MNRYPMQDMAQQLQAQGRYGDDVLVHMNPVELQGIASLTPGGLTRNPQTGQPEAFAFLIPMLASWGGSALAGSMGAGAVGSAIAGGVASGLATGAVTGDWEKGLASGVMGAGLGGALGAAGSAAGEAGAAGAAEALTAVESAQGIAEAAKAAEAAQAAQAMQGMEAVNAADILGNMSNQGLNQFGQAQEAAQMAQMGNDVNAMADATKAIEQATASPSVSEQMALRRMQSDLPANVGQTTGSAGSRVNLPDMGGPTSGYGSGFKWEMPSGEEYGQAMKQPFQKGSGLMGELQDNAMTIGIGGGSLAKQERMDKEARQAAKIQKARDQKRYDLENTIREGSLMAQPNLATGINTLENYGYDFDDYRRLGFSNAGYSDGGIVKLAKGGKTDPISGASPEALRLAQQVQLGLRGRHNVTPPSWFRPGIDGEFDYFQNDPENISEPWRMTDEYYYNLYPEFRRIGDAQRVDRSKDKGGDEDNRVTPIDSDLNDDVNVDPTGRNDRGDNWDYTDTDPEDDGWFYGGRDMDKGRWKAKFAEGGEVPLQTDFGVHNVPAGGIANMSTPLSQPAVSGQPQAPTMEDIKMVEAALTGKAGDKADVIIDVFIKRYGQQVFQKVMEMIMTQGHQGEGKIEGEGDGMSDSVPAMIDNQQPAALSDGEYVVPADAVADLGNGSTDAGVAKLDENIAKLRQARHGTTEQPPAVNPDQFLG